MQHRNDVLIQSTEFIIWILESRIIELVFRVSSSSQTPNTIMEHSLLRGPIEFICRKFHAVYKLASICKEGLALEVQRCGCATLKVAFEEAGNEQPGAVMGGCLCFQKNDMQMRNFALLVNQTMKLWKMTIRT